MPRAAGGIIQAGHPRIAGGRGECAGVDHFRRARGRDPVLSLARARAARIGAPDRAWPLAATGAHAPGHGADVAAALERARAIGRSDAHRIREQGIYRQAWNPNSARQAGRQSPGCLGSRGYHRVSGRAQAAGGGATAQERRRRCAARHPRRHAARARLGEAAAGRIVAPRPHHRWHSRRGHGPARP